MKEKSTYIIKNTNLMRCFLSLCLLIACFAIPSYATVRLENLRCEYRVNPLGIDERLPRLSWEMMSDERGKSQTAYQILVASRPELLSSEKADLWNSGKVNSEESNQIVYQGKSLTSHMQCCWQVRIWDEEDKPSVWSTTASWTMGLLNPSDWQARWIAVNDPGAPVEYISAGKDPKPKKRYPVRMFRREFHLNKPVRRAVVYATALGVYELSINGSRVGKDYFTPGWTEYDQRIFYQTYNVTELLKTPGDNAVGALLGDGWYTLRHGGQGKERLKVQLRIEFDDGDITTIQSDSNWKSSANGPIRMSDMFDGETYDARLEMPGWNEAGFLDADWQPAVEKEYDDVPLTAHPGSPVQKIKTIHPLRISEPKPGMFVYDMGQNFVGWVRMRVKALKGTQVSMRFAEMLNPDGTIYTENLRTAKVTDTYICRGDSIEEWEPRFTFHGFRYIEVTGFPGKPDLDAITGIVLHSNAPVTSSFECSNPMINKLYENIVWGQRSNYFEIPTDCPQRDERKGWTGDAQIFIQTGAYNMDIAAFYTAWILTLNDCFSKYGFYHRYVPTKFKMGPDVPRAGWGDAGITCPWTLYRMYGDKRILERHYQNMAKWIDILEEHTEKYFNPPADYATNYEYDQKGSTGFGDWLNQDGDCPTRKYVINTAYFGYVTKLMAKVAHVLDKESDEKRFNELFKKIRQKFQQTFVADNGSIMGDTQTTYLMALYFDLLPDSLRQPVFDHLLAKIEQADWHPTTGFLGVNLLLPTLSEYNRSDVAYRLMTTSTFPSWGYFIKHGATTIWERWDGWTEENGFYDPKMNSFNHYVFGACGQWLFSDMAGIDTDGPAFKKIIIRPRIDDAFSYVKAEYHSIHGKIGVHWQKLENEILLNVTIPANTTAKIYIPRYNVKDLLESGRPAASADGVTFFQGEGDSIVYRVESGQYSFKSIVNQKQFKINGDH